jgi:hypothetical protein
MPGVIINSPSRAAVTYFWTKSLPKFRGKSGNIEPVGEVYVMWGDYKVLAWEIRMSSARMDAELNVVIR